MSEEINYHHRDSFRWLACKQQRPCSDEAYVDNENSYRYWCITGYRSRFREPFFGKGLRHRHRFAEIRYSESRPNAVVLADLMFDRSLQPNRRFTAMQGRLRQNQAPTQEVGVKEATRILCILLSNGNIGMDQPSNFLREAGIPTTRRKPVG